MYLVSTFDWQLVAEPTNKTSEVSRAPKAHALMIFFQPVRITVNATFTYDADGSRVKSVLTTNAGVTTTYFVGNHYEVTNGLVTKYYYAGSQRVAMRKNGTLTYILGDHLGSTSLLTDANGAVINQTKYKAWGETRYSSGGEVTEYQYTGQYSYESDFGLMFYQSRFYDPQLGRFSSPDTIIPEQSQGVQAWDRYAYVNNSPINYTDPTGHCLSGAVLDTIACIGLLLIFSSMSDTEKNFSPQEIESRKDTFELGATVLSLPLAIRYPIAEFVSNIYDCATSALACATTIAPGSTSTYTNNLLSPPSQFGSSGSFVLTEKELLDFGHNYGGNNGYTFITRTSDVDAFEFATISEIERRLGRNFPEESVLVRVDIDDITLHNPSVPGTNITGNSNYLGSGYTSGGLPEMIINPINLRIPSPNIRVSQLRYVE